MNKPQKIRWLIAHEPVELFLRTAEAFRDKIAELTDGQFEVEIYTPSFYKEQVGIQDQYNNASLFSLEDNGPMVAMDKGDIEMSQLHVTELALWHSPEFWALELPFLFRDHDHASRVFEGPIGQKMLGDLAEKSPATGLAFTYSGGFRCLVSEEKLNGVDDIAGLEYATGINPITIDMVEAVGAKPNPFPIRDHARKAAGEGFTSDALETTIPRFLAQFQNTSKKYLLNTKHSLFLTSIVISNKFWSSLSEETQAAFREACLYASRLERKWSVEDAVKFAAGEFVELGIDYAELSEEDTAKFKELTAPLYNKYRTFFYPGLVDGIIQS